MNQLPAPVRTAQTQPNGDGFDDGGFVFRPATREQIKARLAIQGVSGSGKTWTSLAIAHGLADGQRFAVIDTERGAASKYVGVRGIQFDVCPMTKYDPRDLVRALAVAAQHGYPVVLIDSLSHYWKGTDGTLDQVDRAKSKYGNNSFAGWKDGTPIQNEMVDALLTYPGHVIATMRAKTQWVVQDGPRGKEPVRMGMAAEQRQGVEYEFDVVASMDISNTLTVLKSRCPALHNRVVEQPDGGALAKELLEWLNDGTESVDATVYIDRAVKLTTYDDALALHREVESHGLLATPYLDGETPTSLGDYIKARGTALKNAPTPQPGD